MVSCQIRSRCCVLLRSPVELFHPLVDVRLLHAVSLRSSYAEVFMVEEIPHQNANVPIRVGLPLLLEPDQPDDRDDEDVCVDQLVLHGYIVLAVQSLLPDILQHEKENHGNHQNHGNNGRRGEVRQRGVSQMITGHVWRRGILGYLRICGRKIRGRTFGTAWQSH